MFQVYQRLRNFGRIVEYDYKKTDLNCSLFYVVYGSPIEAYLAKAYSTLHKNELFELNYNIEIVNSWFTRPKSFSKKVLEHEIPKIYSKIKPFNNWYIVQVRKLVLELLFIIFMHP